MQVLLDVSRALSSSAHVRGRPRGHGAQGGRGVRHALLSDPRVRPRARRARRHGPSTTATTARATTASGVAIEARRDARRPRHPRGRRGRRRARVRPRACCRRRACSMEKWGEKTCLNVPLWFKGQPVGMMMLLETAEERHFTDDELDLARADRRAGGGGDRERTSLPHAQAEVRDRQAHRALQQPLPARAVWPKRSRAPVATSVPISLLIVDVDDFRRFTVAAGRQLANEAALDRHRHDPRASPRASRRAAPTSAAASSPCCCRTQPRRRGRRRPPSRPTRSTTTATGLHRHGAWGSPSACGVTSRR